jgi:hypothetical protein
MCVARMEISPTTERFLPGNTLASVPTRAQLSKTRAASLLLLTRAKPPPGASGVPASAEQVPVVSAAV